MLVTSRRIGEGFVIGEDLKVKILSIGKYIVRFGLERNGCCSQKIIREGETQYFGNIEMKIRKIGKSQVSIGIQAPEDVLILRDELIVH